MLDYGYKFFSVISPPTTLHLQLRLRFEKDLRFAFVATDAALDADVSIFEADGVEIIYILFPDNHRHLLVRVSAVEIEKEMTVSVVIDPIDLPAYFGVFAYVIFRFGSAVCSESKGERDK